MTFRVCDCGDYKTIEVRDADAPRTTTLLVTRWDVLVNPDLEVEGLCQNCGTEAKDFHVSAERIAEFDTRLRELTRQPPPKGADR